MGESKISSLNTLKNRRLNKQTNGEMKRLFFFSILWVAVLLLPGGSVLAQAEQKVRGAKAWEIRGLNHDSIIAAFGRRFVVLDSLMRSDVEVDRALLFADTPHMQQVDSAFEAKEAYERKAFKRKHGLELTGQAYYRLDDQLGFDEDDQYSRYKAKFQGELGWNLFNSSFLQRKPQLRLISLNNQADRLHHLRQNARPLWDDAREAIEQRYNRLTAAVLREQLLNNEVLSMAYLYVLETDRASNDKLLEAGSEKMRIEHALAQTGMPADASGEEVRVLQPLWVELDTARLLGALEDNHLQIRESRVREEILGAQIKVTNYAHQLRLTPFVRVSHYLRTTPGSSTNMEVGARFTFPFYGDASAKRKAMRTEQALTALGREKLTETVTTECRRLIAQLGQLNTALASEQRHVALLRRFIDIRTEGYVNSQGGYNHIARLEEYNEFLRSLERTYDLLRRRALCLLELQEATGCPDMAALIQTKEMTR